MWWELGKENEIVCLVCRKCGRIWNGDLGLEKLQEKYVRWVLGVDGRMSGYMVREDGKRENMRSRLGKRVLRKCEEKGGMVGRRIAGQK